MKGVVAWLHECSHADMAVVSASLGVLTRVQMVMISTNVKVYRRIISFLFSYHPTPPPPQDSGLDNGEDVSHFDHQVSNPDQYGSEMDFQYTDNVAYGAVSSHRHTGSSEQLRGTQKQSVGVIASHIQFTEQTVGATEWDSAPDHRPFVVTLRQDPNCRDKEYVTFGQPPRVPPKSHTSSSSLQTSL